MCKTKLHSEWNQHIAMHKVGNYILSVKSPYPQMTKYRLWRGELNSNLPL